MTKPDDIPQDVWQVAQNICDQACMPEHYYTNGVVSATQEDIARAIIAAKAEERNKHVSALVDLDRALCQFLNNAADEYDPRLWIPSIKRDFRDLAKAYDQCHAIGSMDVNASIRERGEA